MSGDPVALHNALELLDEYIAWATKGSEKVTIEFFPGPGVRLHADELTQMSINFRAPPPLRFWECSPACGKRWLTLTVQSEGETCGFVFSGATWPFRDIFDEYAVKGYYQESGEETQYFRALPKLALDDKALVSRLLNALQVAVRVVTPGLISAAWLEALMGPFVHFV